MGVHKETLTCFKIRVIYHTYTLYLPSYRSQARVVVQREHRTNQLPIMKKQKFIWMKAAAVFALFARPPGD